LSADQGIPVSASARVEIDLFSGRPNPSFTLDPSATHRLLGLLGSLARSDGKAVRRDGLGFRGFAVSIQGQPEIYVSGPAVSAGSRQLMDQERVIERFLLSEMPADLRRQFRDALPP
jgi:hypothetical protein